MPFGERTQRGDQIERPTQHQGQRVAHDEHVGVVGDERAGGAEVEVRPRRRSLFAERVHVRHHVVAEPLFECGSGVEVGVVEMRAHRVESRTGDGHPELLLGLGEREPDPAPLTDPMRLAPQALHRRRCVARGERRLPVCVVH